MNKTKKTAVRAGALFVACAFVLTAGLFAHDEGHKTPDALPPIGPHGGKYAKMTRHFAEIVVRDGTVTVYILEPDVKFVAEDAADVTAAYEIPGKQPKTALPLTKAGNGYRAAFRAPSGARRVIFYVGCSLDGKAESGQIDYEPGR
jgi:hypothetical protein